MTIETNNLYNTVVCYSMEIGFISLDAYGIYSWMTSPSGDAQSQESAVPEDDGSSC